MLLNFLSDSACLQKVFGVLPSGLLMRKSAISYYYYYYYWALYFWGFHLQFALRFNCVWYINFVRIFFCKIGRWFSCLVCVDNVFPGSYLEFESRGKFAHRRKCWPVFMPVSTCSNIIFNILCIYYRSTTWFVLWFFNILFCFGFFRVFNKLHYLHCCRFI